MKPFLINIRKCALIRNITFAAAQMHFLIINNEVKLFLLFFVSLFDGILQCMKRKHVQ